MYLKEIFDNLRHGELRMLSIGGQAQGVINNSNQAIIVNTLNMALTAIHARFSLRQRSVDVLLIPGVYTYQLKTNFLVGNTSSVEPVRYLEQVENTFTDSLLKVERVCTNEGYDLSLNDGRKYACSTPSTRLLRVDEAIVDQSPDLPDEYKTTRLGVYYRDNHPLFVLEDNGVLDGDEDELEVDLPYPYMEPLLYYMASRLHHPLGASADFQMGASYAAKYEQACQRLEQVNLQIDKGLTNTRLERNGWV